jgi:hypothetical protein
MFKIFIGSLSVCLVMLSTNIVSAQSTTDPQTKTQQINWLGVSLMTVSDALKSQLGNLLNTDQGVMIKSVQANSPAQKAGLQSYDILRAFNGIAITSTQQVYDLVQQNKANKSAKLDIIRKGQKRMISAIIGTREVNTYQTNQASFPSVPRHSFNNNFWNSPFPPFPQTNWNSFFNQPPLQPNGNSLSTPGFPLFPQQLSNGMQSWSHSESMNIKTLANGNIHAELKTKDTDGNEKNFIFEGNRETVIQDIQQQKGLPENQKKNLINALQGNSMMDINQNFFENFPYNPNNSMPQQGTMY